MKPKKSKSGFTVCVHEGNQHALSLGINSPIYTSTSYGYLDTDERLYPRYFNIPNQKVVIEKLASLENTETGLLFGSGMAAISTTLLSLLSKGDHCIFQHGLYGGTFNFIVSELQRFGIEFTLLKDNQIKSFQSAIKKNTRLVYIETPSNPLLSVIDLKQIGDLCRQKNCISVVDNTFASPINQNPVNFGIDVVIHSATKYLGGHSDICAGAVLSDNNRIEKIQHTAMNFGGSLNALMCSLLERSIKTLAVRIQKHNENALKIAEYLQKNTKIQKVYYPGLEGHPGHEIARKQMSGFGGMLSFELKGKDCINFQKKLKLVKPAMSLGGVESLICSPAITSHRHLSEQQRKEEGIQDNLLRLSVGIEDSDDILEDIEQALKN